MLPLLCNCECLLHFDTHEYLYFVETEKITSNVLETGIFELVSLKTETENIFLTSFLCFSENENRKEFWSLDYINQKYTYSNQNLV